MKIIEGGQESVRKKLVFSRFFGELYYFFVLHLYVILSIVGAALSIAFLLFIAELIFPNAVHVFNSSLSDWTFNGLMKDHKYHAAIALMDIKSDLIEESGAPYIFRQRLADCYIHTGDYPKALEQYKLASEYFDKKLVREAPKDWPPTKIQRARNLINIRLLQAEFRVYLKMGDIASIRKCYGTMKSIHESTDWGNLDDLFSEEEREKLKKLLDGRKFEDGFKLELIQGKYRTQPEEAIAEMAEYTIDVANSEKYNQLSKIELFNELIGMLIEQEQRIAGRHYLEFALQIVDSLEYNTAIYEYLGNLSEYCYLLNDAEDGYRLLKKYLCYIDDTYDRTDIDYALAHAMEFKYLEMADEWDCLAERVIETNTALRQQIALNFTGMTSAQREYFIEQFKPLFSYTNRLMELHPSDRLATACFENNMFLRGLLLRSETSVANAIASMGDKDLSTKYERYVKASQELVTRQYVSGPGNYYAREKLESEIAALETEIANASRDFRRETETANLSVSQLKKSLNKDDVVMEIVEGDKNVFALLLDKSGEVLYKPIASKRLLSRLTKAHGTIYVDRDAVDDMFGSIIPAISGKNVYLTTSGMFNQISFNALPADDKGHIFADIAKIHVVGSPMDIPNIKSSEKIDLTAKSTILWGGIEYGSSDTIPSGISETIGIMRGDVLRKLPNSLTEVNAIAGLLRNSGNHPKVISGCVATEKSFTSRSGNKDYILHISTHGFFHDSGTFTNPMRNSGLLFANSQKYWMSDNLASSINDSDGILRADEIAKSDLNGCRLVVLSACQTGLGEYNSEGVYGLQRAFKLAGAQSILMSLWSVDDKATAELMTEFYKGLISGLEPDDALVSAQQALRQKGYSPDKWAAFVVLN